MRQAGRYLPEYRELRAKSESFMHFCFTPKMASDATIQPIERFGFDAAILFSDILVIPEALGQKVSFEQGEGPRLSPISTAQDLAALHDQIDMGVLNPVFETVGLVKSRLPDNVAFIGFCGAPWTVASYMIAGRGTPDQAPARIFAYRHPDLFSLLIEKLVRSSVDYLEQQVRAGVEVVQIFDSWAGVLPDAEFEKWCLKPVVSMARELKRRCPDVRIIAFSRGAKTRLASFLGEASIDALGLDTSDDVNWTAKNIQMGKPVQGNLDPLILLAGGDALRREAQRIVAGFAGGPHIFNLGHGILPTTPIENVELLLKTVRQG
jgi:uroporphyrinogen decarboxylase